VVLEKSEVVGGTTGVSGGVVWVPNNDHLAADGLVDSREDALAYIRRVADGRAPDDSLIEVFVDMAPTVLRYLEAKTPLRIQRLSGVPDYYAAIADRIPGCKTFSRSVESAPFPARETLGEWFHRTAARSTLLSSGAYTTSTEDVAAWGGVMPDPDELARREREGYLVKGAAIVASLLKGALDRDVDIRTSFPARELIVDDEAAVVGVRASHGGEDAIIGARKGVILACGGFEWNRDMVLAYLGFDVQPLTPGGNTGDGQLMAMEAGALMGCMGTFWGHGAIFDPALTRPDGKPQGQLTTGLGSGSIVVNRLGRRFMHGGHTYNDLPGPFGHYDQEYAGRPNQPPAWIIFGPSVKERGAIMTMQPGEPAPDWLPQAGNVWDLAKQIGLDPDALEETVHRFNSDAAAGADPEWHTASPAPIDGPPFYALQLWPGTIGTTGGPRINADGQVLGHRRTVIDGLYSAGNTAAAPLGGAYLGGGTTIGAAITFGFLAGQHAGTRTDRTI
jgi:succinate dehydrogenase/fumarate reductase flavoprotein subunit